MLSLLEFSSTMYLSFGDLPVYFPVSTIAAPVEAKIPSSFDMISSTKDSTLKFLWKVRSSFIPIDLSPNFSDSQRALIGIQPQTGCLDEEAFNYTSEPVLPCDDCCDYCQNDGLIDISIVPDEYPEYISWELWYKGKYVLSSQYMYPTLIASGNFNGENISE